MKRRGEEKDPCRILTFGCLNPTAGADDLWAELRRAHDYRNDLARVEIARRGAWRAVHADHPDLAPLAEAVRSATSRVAEARRAINDKRDGAGRDVDVEKESAEVKALLVALGEAYGALIEASRKVRAWVEGRLAARAEVASARLAHAEAKIEGPRSRRRAAVKEVLRETERAAVYALAEEGTISTADAALWGALDAIEVRRADLVRRLRAASGLEPGTYLLVEKAAEAWSDWSKEPRTRRWEREGRVGVHFSGGLDVANLGAGGSHLRLDDVVEPEARGKVAENAYRRRDGSVVERGRSWPGQRTGPLRCHGRHRGKLRLIRIRVGSTGQGGRQPVWAELPVILHRPLPAEGRVKDAWVRAERVGIETRWHLQVVLDSPDFRLPEKPALGQRGRCAIDVGWRNLPESGVEWETLPEREKRRRLGGVRVGVLVDDEGLVEEIRIPPVVRGGASYELAEAILKADSIEGIRDREFESACLRLSGWLRLRAPGEIPEWLADRTRSLADAAGVRWRSQGRMAALLRNWEARRFPGDETVIDHLRKWVEQDRHLLRWSSRMRARAIAHRREIWRCVAARLAARYAEIIVEDFRQGPGHADLTTSTHRPLPEEGPPSDDKFQRVSFRLAAVRELVSAIAWAARKSGSRFEEKDPARTTIIHWRCGEALDVSHRRQEIRLHCPKCDEQVDQDENAARNLLASGPATLGDGEALAGSKSAKRRKNRRRSRGASASASDSCGGARGER